MSRFWQVVSVGSVAAAGLWLVGFWLVPVIYSLRGLAFFVLLAGTYYWIGSAAAVPSRVAPGASAGALAGIGATVIVAAGLTLTHRSTGAQSWASWLNSAVFLLVTQLILGAAIGGIAAWWSDDLA